MSEKLDGLTGLPVGLDDDLKLMLANRGGVAVVLLDVDHFMEINTSFGRNAGDRVLQLVGELLADAFPGGAYRTAGDEFGALLPGVALEQAFLRTEALRLRVAAATERFALPDGRAITITAGVAHAPRDGRDAAGVLRKAYAALGAAKEAGRNQVALPPAEDMVMKSCYYGASALKRLKALAEQVNRKESDLLREALDDLLHKYDQPE